MREFLSIIKIFCTLFVIIIVCGCKFPDNNLDWQNILNYRLDALKFGETTIENFMKSCPDAKQEQVGRGIDIFNTEAENKYEYKRIRVGFKHKKLDWIEFGLNKDINMFKIVELYGKPHNINKAYSKSLDYYDYGNFNISTDKKHNFAKSINIFEVDNRVNPIARETIPDLLSLNKVDFLNLKPGITLEAAFNDKYPELPAHKKTKFDAVSSYVLDYELGKARQHYKKAVIVFNSGLLSWINLTPQNLSLDKAIKFYGTDYKIESLNTKYNFYHYKSLVLTVDKAQKKVINIGILSPADNLKK